MERQQGKYHTYKYMIYAHTDQDVISGFGDKNKAFLHDVAARYDPAGIFQNLQPGGFELCHLQRLAALFYESLQYTHNTTGIIFEVSRMDGCL